MKFLKSISRWRRELFRKRRLSLRDASDGAEEWHIHLSPAGAFAAFVSFALLLFILILVLAAYTPVLEYLPGYRTEATRTREALMRDAMRLDSMERMMNDMMTYNEHIALIMEGKTPVVRSLRASDSARLDKTLVPPSRADSLLRAQMEGDSPYGLGAEGSRREMREAIGMITPVEGILTEGFDIKQGRLGIRIAAAAGAGVSAIGNGTVVLSLWTPEEGHVVQIQHPDNLLSVYKHLSQSLVSPGQTVRSSEVIGYAAAPDADRSEETRLFEFELWNDGKPVDPEGYIVF